MGELGCGKARYMWWNCAAFTRPVQIICKPIIAEVSLVQTSILGKAYYAKTLAPVKMLLYT